MEQMEFDFSDDEELKTTEETAVEKEPAELEAENKRLLARLGFDHVSDASEIDTVVKDCLLCEKMKKKKDGYEGWFNSITKDNCEIYRLDYNHPFDSVVNKDYPLYLIKYKDSWNLIENLQKRDIIEKEPDDLALYFYYHCEACPSVLSAFLHLGDKLNLTREESSKLKFFECPDHRYMLTPRQFVEYKLLDQSCIDFYSDEKAKFDSYFTNELRKNVLVSLGKKDVSELEKDERELDFYRKETIEVFVKNFGCDREITERVVNKLYEIFPETPFKSKAFGGTPGSHTPAHERAKVLPLLCGKYAHNKGSEKGINCQFDFTEEELGTVFGIYDKNLDITTILDRIWVAKSGMSKEEISKLVEYDYSTDVEPGVSASVTAEVKTPSEEKTVSADSDKEKIEALIKEINPDGGRARGFQIAAPSVNHLNTMKQWISEWTKMPPKESDREKLEKDIKKAQKEVKRFEKIINEEHDEDAKLPMMQWCDIANFYSWQIKKLDMIKDINENLVPAVKAIYDKDERLNGTQTPEAFINKFTNTLINLDFFGLFRSHYCNDSLNPIIDKIIENRLGEKFPDKSTIPEEDYRAVRELWLANRTNVTNSNTQNRGYFFKSEKDAVEHCVSMGGNVAGSIERVNDFFAKNSNDKDRIAFLKEEYGNAGVYGSVLGYGTGFGKNGSKGLTVEGYYCEDNNKTQFKKFNRVITWKEICDEIKRQRLLQIYGKDRVFDRTPIKIEDDIKIIEENTIKQEKDVRAITINHNPLSALNRYEFLSGLREYKNGEPGKVDAYNMAETLLSNSLKPVAHLYEGRGSFGNSAYESFVCKSLDNTGYRYICVPRNPDYYKGFDKLILSEKTYDSYEDCLNALVEEIVNTKDNHDYELFNADTHLYNIPQEYTDLFLDYIVKNEPEIVEKSVTFVNENEGYDKNADLKKKVLYFLNSKEGIEDVDFDTLEWREKFENLAALADNSLFNSPEKTKPVKETKPFIKEPDIHYNIYPEHTGKKNWISLNLHFNKDELLSFVKPENEERMKDLSLFISEEPVRVEISYSDGSIKRASIIGKVNLEKSGICGHTVYLQDNELPSVFGENVEKEILSYCEDNLHKKIEDMKEEYEQMPPSVKKTMDRKLSNYTSVWYKGAGYSVKDMLDDIIQCNGADFTLDEEPDGIWHLAYHEHKVRGMMTVDGTMVEYLKRHLKGEYWQNKFSEFEQKMYESYIHSFNPDSVTDEGLEDMLKTQKEGWNTGAVKALEEFIEKRSLEKTVETNTEITENKKMAKELKDLTPEIFAKIYNEEIEETTCVRMDIPAAKAVLDSLKDRWKELGLKTTGNTIHCVNGYFEHDTAIAREILRISIVGREEKASTNLDRRTEVIFDSLGMIGDKKKQLFERYVKQAKDIIEKEDSYYFEKHIAGKDDIAVPVFKYMLSKHNECFDRYDFSEENKLPYFDISVIREGLGVKVEELGKKVSDIGHADFRIYEPRKGETRDSVVEYLKSSGLEVKPVNEEYPNRIAFDVPLDKVDSVVKELKEKGFGEYDMSYGYEGTTIDGIDAAWCDNIADTKVYSESEFDLINLDKELSFIEKGEPYISVPFTEGSSSDYKHCHIEGGTIYGFKDGIEKIDRYVKQWNTFLKTDITFNMYDSDKKGFVSYRPNFEFLDNKTTDEHGKEKERYQESIVEFVRSICSYPEVLDLFEKTWIKEFTPGVSEEQRKFVEELTADTFSKAKKKFNELSEELKKASEKKSSELSHSFIIEASKADALDKNVKDIQKEIANSLGFWLEHLTKRVDWYIHDDPVSMNEDEFIEYARHEIKNCISDVKYSDSRNAHYGDSFDFGNWRKALEFAVDDYDGFMDKVFALQEEGWKQTAEYAEEIKERFADNKNAVSLDKYGRELTPLQNLAYQKLSKITIEDYQPAYYHWGKNEVAKPSPIWDFISNFKYVTDFVGKVFESTFIPSKTNAIEKYLSELTEDDLNQENFGKTFSKWFDIRNEVITERNITLTEEQLNVLKELPGTENLDNVISWQELDDTAWKLDNECDLDKDSLQIFSDLCKEYHIDINDTWYLSPEETLKKFEELGFKLVPVKERSIYSLDVINLSTNEKVSSYRSWAIGDSHTTYTGFNRNDDIADSYTRAKLSYLAEHYWNNMPSHIHSINIEDREHAVLDKLFEYAENESEFGLDFSVNEKMTPEDVEYLLSCFEDAACENILSKDEIDVLNNLCKKTGNDSYVFLSLEETVDKFKALGYKPVFAVEDGPEVIKIIRLSDNKEITKYAEWLSEPDHTGTYYGFKYIDESVTDENLLRTLEELSDHYWNIIPSHLKSIFLTSEEVEVLRDYDHEYGDPVGGHWPVTYNNNVSVYGLKYLLSGYTQYEKELSPKTFGILKNIAKKLPSESKDFVLEKDNPVRTVMETVEKKLSRLDGKFTAKNVSSVLSHFDYVYNNPNSVKNCLEKIGMDGYKALTDFAAAHDIIFNDSILLDKDAIENKISELGLVFRPIKDWNSIVIYDKEGNRVAGFGLGVYDGKKTFGLSEEELRNKGYSEDFIYKLGNYAERYWQLTLPSHEYNIKLTDKEYDVIFKIKDSLYPLWETNLWPETWQGEDGDRLVSPFIVSGIYEDMMKTEKTFSNEEMNVMLSLFDRSGIEYEKSVLYEKSGLSDTQEVILNLEELWNRHAATDNYYESDFIEYLEIGEDIQLRHLPGDETKTWYDLNEKVTNGELCRVVTNKDGMVTLCSSDSEGKEEDCFTISEDDFKNCCLVITNELTILKEVSKLGFSFKYDPTLNGSVYIHRISDGAYIGNSFDEKPLEEIGEDIWNKLKVFAEEYESKSMGRSGNTPSVSELVDGKYDFDVLADKIIQYGYGDSASGFEDNLDFEQIAVLAEKDVDWVRENIHNICDALSKDEDFLIDFNEQDALVEEDTLSLFFYSTDGCDYNELFKYDEGTKRWSRKSNEELYREELISEEEYENGKLYEKNEEFFNKYGKIYSRTYDENLKNENKLHFKSNSSLYAYCMKNSKDFAEKVNELAAARNNNDFDTIAEKSSVIDTFNEMGTDFLNISFDIVSEQNVNSFREYLCLVTDYSFDNVESKTLINGLLMMDYYPVAKNGKLYIADPQNDELNEVDLPTMLDYIDPDHIKDNHISNRAFIDMDMHFNPNRYTVSLCKLFDRKGRDSYGAELIDAGFTQNKEKDCFSYKSLHIKRVDEGNNVCIYFYSNDGKKDRQAKLVTSEHYDKNIFDAIKALCEKGFSKDKDEILALCEGRTSDVSVKEPSVSDVVSKSASEGKSLVTAENFLETLKETFEEKPKDKDVVVKAFKDLLFLLDGKEKEKVLKMFEGCEKPEDFHKKLIEKLSEKPAPERKNIKERDEGFER